MGTDTATDTQSSQPSCSHTAHTENAKQCKTSKTGAPSLSLSLSLVPLCEEEVVTAYVHDSHGWSLAKCVDL